MSLGLRGLLQALKDMAMNVFSYSSELSICASFAPLFGLFWLVPGFLEVDEVVQRSHACVDVLIRVS